MAACGHSYCHFLKLAPWRRVSLFCYEWVMNLWMVYPCWCGRGCHLFANAPLVYCNKVILQGLQWQHLGVFARFLLASYNVMSSPFLSNMSSNLFTGSPLEKLRHHWRYFCAWRVFLNVIFDFWSVLELSARSFCQCRLDVWTRVIWARLCFRSPPALGIDVYFSVSQNSLSVPSPLRRLDASSRWFLPSFRSHSIHCPLHKLCPQKVRPLVNLSIFHFRCYYCL